MVGISARPVARLLKWTAAVVLGTVVLVAGFIALFGWNWLRGPIERVALDKTGRVLALQGDLALSFAWPMPRLYAADVTFANPHWAAQRQMLTASGVEVTLDVMQLLSRRIVFPQVRLENPVILLERGTQGRKSWLLDLNQQDEDARIQIGLLSLDRGTLGYDDLASKTSIRSSLSTTSLPEKGGEVGVVYTATGRFNGLGLKASGTGGPVLAIRDESAPYPLTLNATVGRTTLQAQGTVTSLLKFSAIDMALDVKGDSLEQLFPLLGIAMPATGAYATRGHLVHQSGLWAYEKFSGRVGKSDLAGSLKVDVSGPRPMLVADLTSSLLDIEDLGPLIGARPGSVKSAQQALPALVAPAGSASTEPPAPTPSAARVLPDLPFKTDRWSSLNADVKLSAKSIRRAADLPLENLLTRLKLQDSVMTLDPLNFGLAGGQLIAVISLDGRSHPISARAQVRARKVQLGKLMPAIKLNQPSLGQINGEFDLVGRGDTVRQMLATSNGKLGLVIANGEISKLMMETAGLHLWEILELKISGDRPVKLRCGVADFDVKEGLMQAQAIVFDTAVTTLLGTGTIDLGEERLDLTFNQKTKNTSPLALRSPIHVRGTFAKPQVGVNKGQMAARALGAIALGAVNPLLALLPLIDPGPGQDSDCKQLVRDARAVPRKGGNESRSTK